MSQVLEREKEAFSLRMAPHMLSTTMIMILRTLTKHMVAELCMDAVDSITSYMPSIRQPRIALPSSSTAMKAGKSLMESIIKTRPSLCRVNPQEFSWASTLTWAIKNSQRLCSYLWSPCKEKLQRFLRLGPLDITWRSRRPLTKDWSRKLTILWIILSFL